MTGFEGGTALLLGVLLLAAGALKLARPGEFARAVEGLLPAGPTQGAAEAGRARLARASAPVVGSCEMAVGALLAGAPWWPPRVDVTAAAAAVVLYTGFVGIVALAYRKDAACGCWSSYSDGPATGRELGRAAGLAALAVALLAVDLVAAPRSGWHWAALLWTLGGTAGVVVTALAGAALLPARVPAVTPSP